MRESVVCVGWLTGGLDNPTHENELSNVVSFDEVKLII